MQKKLIPSVAKYFLIVTMCIGWCSVMAQESEPPVNESQAQSGQTDAEKSDEEKKIPVDLFDRGTPRRTAEGFMAAADVGDFQRAAEYLDLRNLRGEATEYTGVQLARRFFVITRRGEWTEVADFVDNPEGRAGDGLPNYRDSIGYVKHEDQNIQLFMQRVPRGDGVSIWKVSNSSVSLIPELYETYGYSEEIERTCAVRYPMLYFSV